MSRVLYKKAAKKKWTCQYDIRRVERPVECAYHGVNGRLEMEECNDHNEELAGAKKAAKKKWTCQYDIRRVERPVECAYHGVNGRLEMEECNDHNEELAGANAEPAGCTDRLSGRKSVAYA